MYKSIELIKQLSMSFLRNASAIAFLVKMESLELKLLWELNF